MARRKSKVKFNVRKRVTNGTIRTRTTIMSLPDEIISEILRLACDDAGQESIDKFRFPSIPNLISERFYSITMRSPLLWRYIVFQTPPYDHICSRLERTGKVPLDVTITLIGSDEEAINILLRVQHRIQRLYFRSPSSTSPLGRVLKNKMPELEELNVSGPFSKWGLIRLAPSNFPKLKKFAATRGISCAAKDSQLPDSVRDARFMAFKIGSSRWINGLATFLPGSLHTLRLWSLALTFDLQSIWRTSPIKILLPKLAYLEFMGIFGANELFLLRCIQAPSLSSLGLTFDEEVSSMTLHEIDWALDFPSVKTIQISTSHRLPPLQSFLASCSENVTHLWFDTTSYHPEIAEFVHILAGDPTWFPGLKSFKALGVSLVSIEEMARKRLGLDDIELLPLDCGLTSLATPEEFEELEHAVDWLMDNIDGISWYFTTDETPFKSDGMDRYRTWEDMKRGIALDNIDWVGMDDDDGDFWISWSLEVLRQMKVEAYLATQSYEAALEHSLMLQKQLAKHGISLPSASPVAL